MVCASCSQPKHKLKTRKSRLASVDLLLCDTCFDKKFEPRYLILVAARRTDVRAPSVAKYIKNKLYHGEPITARELL